MLNVVHLQEFDIDKICKELKMKRDGSPQFFMRIPIVIDCAELDFGSDDKLLLDFPALKAGLQSLGFIPIGVRNAPEGLKALLLKAGWAVLPASSKPNMPNSSRQDEADEKSQPDNVIATEPPVAENKKNQADTTNAKQAPSSLTIDRPVRSGQQIYAQNSDLTILAATSAGSEIMADGSIHVYGALRGRVLAGVNGNQSARIYCSSLQAELIVIAGRYQLLDESNTDLIGKPAMIRLEGEKLVIESLS